MRAQKYLLHQTELCSKLSFYEEWNSAWYPSARQKNFSEMESASDYKCYIYSIYSHFLSYYWNYRSKERIGVPCVPRTAPLNYNVPQFIIFLCGVRDQQDEYIFLMQEAYLILRTVWYSGYLLYTVLDLVLLIIEWDYIPTKQALRKETSPQLQQMHWW